MTPSNNNAFNRRDFIGGALAGVAINSLPIPAFAAADNSDLQSVLSQIPKLHDENVKRLQDWIALPSIAAENRNFPQGPEYMAKLAREAGFSERRNHSHVRQAGSLRRPRLRRAHTVGIYFMYDVKQFDPAEWSSPPLEGRLVDKEGLGKVCVGRGAVNQKGPETAFLGALHAFKAAGKKLPVNLVLVCEGEEEIGSPHFPEIVHQPKVTAALKKCMGVFMPEAGQDPTAASKFHSAQKASSNSNSSLPASAGDAAPSTTSTPVSRPQVDSPTWHLVQALNTLIEPDGHTPAVAGFFDKAKPLTPAQIKMIQDVSAVRSEATVKKQLGIEHWVRRHELARRHDSSRVASPPSTSKDSSRATPVPVEKPFSLTAPSPKSICAWFPT